MRSFVWNSSRRLATDRRGATALEFGLVGLVFFQVLIAVFLLGSYYATVQAVNVAANAAMRAGQVDDSIAGCAAPVSAVAGLVPLLKPANLSLCVARASVNGLTTLSVTASYPFSFALPLFGTTSTTISTSTQMTF